jgi:hypothetical protein
MGAVENRFLAFKLSSRNRAPEPCPPNSRPRVQSEGFLEVLFGRPVDRVTENALRPELRPVVEKDAVRVSRDPRMARLNLR